MADIPPLLEVARLVEEHHAVVYRYAFRLTGSVQDAEDLSQQAFLVAHEKIGQLREAACARSWLLTVLRRCFLKTCRRRIPVPAASLELDLEHIPDERPQEPLDREALDRALEELPFEFRLVIVMFYFDHASYREIADELELPIGTVMSRLSRAKSQLRKRLFSEEVATASDMEPLKAVSPLSKAADMSNNLRLNSAPQDNES